MCVIQKVPTPGIICLANVFAASVQIRIKIFINIYIDQNQQFLWQVI